MRPPIDGPLPVSQLFGGWPASEAYTSQYPWNYGAQIMGHDGIDLAVDSVPIYPVWTGIVQVYSQDWGFGLHCTLTDDQGRMFLYAHLSECHASSGQRVYIHRPFGVTGSSGNSTGPHLHCGLYLPPVDRSNRYGGACDWLTSLDHDPKIALDLSRTNL